MAVLAFTVSYNGKPFCGFARQNEVLTVQGDIERALQIVFHREVLTTCAGRTDSGVHAKGQVISFEISSEEAADQRFQPQKLTSALDSLTHNDIHVFDGKRVADDFSARHSAKSREYSYFICNQPTPSVQFCDGSWHIAKPLDVTAMNEACKYLLGEQDFKSFCVAQSAEKLNSTCRNIISASAKKHHVFGDDLIEIKICGNAFLHSMVRSIVGTLVSIGDGNNSPEWIKEVIDAKNREKAGQCAPPNGLFFMKVNY